MNDSRVSVSFTIFILITRVSTVARKGHYILFFYFLLKLSHDTFIESPYRCLNCKKLISYHMSFQNLVIITDFLSAQG